MSNNIWLYFVGNRWLTWFKTTPGIGWLWGWGWKQDQREATLVAMDINESVCKLEKDKIGKTCSEQ
jgi:hypothetical protein